MTKYTEDDLANMSDEDLANLAVIPEDEPEDIPDEPEAVAPDSDDGSSDEPAAVEDEPEASDEDLDPDDASYEAAGSEPEAEPDSETPVQDPEPEPELEKPEEKSEPVDYEAGYKALMAPFKANGKMIELHSPEELRQLAQMGANYTKKLQVLQPQLKLVRMLENNNLLDESKIGFLIDLEKKNPEAIKKLLKDSGTDPLDIDTSEEPNYRPGNYKVSDEEMAFNTVLEDVSSSSEGRNLIISIDKHWDKKSKEELYRDPNYLKVLHQQQESGIYDQITTEVERRKGLGGLVGVPALQAYIAVGRELTEQNRLVPKTVTGETTAAQPQQPTRQVLETRTAPKKVVTNDKARAAAPVRSTPKKVSQDVNPLNMSDDEFERHMQLAKRL